MKDSEVSFLQRIQVVESDKLAFVKDRQGVQLRMSLFVVAADSLSKRVAKLGFRRQLRRVGAEGFDESGRRAKPVVENGGDVALGQITNRDRSTLDSARHIQNVRKTLRSR
jgi:hypothetical protein